jgi:hypothetical protein
MDDVRKLHPGDIGAVKRKQQQKSGQEDRGAAGNGEPIDKLLAEVKASGRRMFVLDKTSALLDPLEVDLSNRLSLKKITMMRTRPATKEKLTKLCAYFAACETLANASGPISGKSKVVPKVIFNPVIPRMTNETAVSQCENLSKSSKRRSLVPDPLLRFGSFTN